VTAGRRIFHHSGRSATPTTGEPGDRLHPNRAGYFAKGQAIDLEMIFWEAVVAF
jgi:hypothetical protein